MLYVQEVFLYCKLIYKKDQDFFLGHPVDTAAMFAKSIKKTALPLSTFIEKIFPLINSVNEGSLQRAPL